MNFYVGIFLLNQAKYFKRCFISANRLKKRRSNFEVNNWILDSGAFTEISTYGKYRSSVEDYAKTIMRWKSCGNMEKAVSQDYMCESFMLEKTGLSIQDHQRLTIQRYDDLFNLCGDIVLPVLQGFSKNDYLSHIDQYGERLKKGDRVGVGSICKRNKNVGEIEYILTHIKGKRPDLRLHGFGIKTTSLQIGLIRKCLYSADSMAWSFEGRRSSDPNNANKYLTAIGFIRRIENQKVKEGIFV